MVYHILLFTSSLGADKRRHPECTTTSLTLWSTFHILGFHFESECRTFFLPSYNLHSPVILLIFPNSDELKGGLSTESYLLLVLSMTQSRLCSHCDSIVALLHLTPFISLSVNGIWHMGPMWRNGSFVNPYMAPPHVARIKNQKINMVAQRWD